MSEIDLSPEVFTADYVGEPGRRTFFLQSRSEGVATSFLLEKQQVAVLAERLRDVLLMVDGEDTIRSATPGRDPALALQEPLEPQWRVGTMGLAYDEGSENVIVLLEEMQPEEETDPDVGAARVMLRRDQVRAFVLHALAVVGEGRPVCQLCGLPMDPDGHRCPASNGHHPQIAER